MIYDRVPDLVDPLVLGVVVGDQLLDKAGQALQSVPLRHLASWAKADFTNFGSRIFMPG